MGLVKHHEVWGHLCYVPQTHHSWLFNGAVWLSCIFSAFGNSLIYEAAQPIRNRYGMESCFLGMPMGMMYSRAVDPVATYLATLRLCCTSPKNNLLESLPMFFPFSLLTDISKSCPTILLQDKCLICIG